MKKLSLIMMILFVSMILHAQEIFFPTKDGTVLIYKTYDKKDKETSEVRYTIKHLVVKGDDMDITYLIESMDPNEKMIFNEEITIHKKGDILYFDMSNFINKSAFQRDGQIPAELQISGNNMEIPSNPKQGDLLPDASVEMSLKMGFMNMKMSAQVTNRKVEAIEDITVKAGSFKGYKFSSEVNSSMMGIKVKSQNIDWYAKGVGMIKTENFDKNGKLQSYTELTAINP